jgi:FKBP-type peptidyl-prolyl cis-trans isomerase
MKRKTMLNISGAIPAIIICLFLLGGCNKTADDSNSFTFDKDASYAWGMYVSWYSMETQVLIPGVHYDYQSFMEGFKAYNEAMNNPGRVETKFSMDDAINKLNIAIGSYSNWIMGISEADATKSLEEGLAFLAENAKRPGVITLPSGLQYEVLREGSGEKPSIADVVQVHYEGTLIDGFVFDSSYDRGYPIEFPLYGVIQGWTEGLQLMSEGSIYNFYIPSELGYGSSTQGPIPGNSVLIFRVELLGITEDPGMDYWY